MGQPRQCSADSLPTPAHCRGAACGRYTAYMSPTPRLCIVTALAPESRPVRKYLRMRRKDHPSLPCPLYVSKQYALIETGLGKLRAAATVAATLCLYPSIRTVLNLGIAGGTGEHGSRWLAHAVTDSASQRRWYPDLPPLRITPDTGNTLVETVDTPSTDYQADRVFDMEASGVFAAAAPVLGTAGVCCMKILSDGPNADLASVRHLDISALLEPHLPVIGGLIDHLARRDETGRAHQQAANAIASAVTATIHHSESEKHRLQRLLERYLALNVCLPSTEVLLAHRSASKLATWLDGHVDSLALEYRVD